MRSILTRSIFVFIAIMISLSAAWPTLAAPPTYHVTDLGTLGWRGSVGNAINASGTVVGGSYYSVDVLYWHAFRYDTSMHDMGTLGGIESSGNAINDSGTVVGYSYLVGNNVQHAFRYDTSMHDLGTLGGSLSYAAGINASGIIVGGSNITGDNAYHIFRYDASMHDLGTLGGTRAAAEAINDSGMVTGWSYIAGDNGTHAFRYDTSLHDLGTLGGADSTGYAINASGTVAGSSNIPGDNFQHAFRYDTSMHDLGTLGGTDSHGSGINASGTVVGSSYTSGNGLTTHGFYYDTAMVDLNNYLDASSTGWTVTAAGGINDKGQICGIGYFGLHGEGHAILMTPVISASIVNVWMKTNRLIEIETLRDFGNQQRAVQVSVSLNGKEYPGSTQMRGSNTELDDPMPLTFDLVNSAVPRFTENVILTVTVSGTMDNGLKWGASAQLVVLLPVVLVPGIDPGGGSASMGGNGTFRALENYLHSQSDILIFNHTPKLFGAGYRLMSDVPLNQGYPTLFTLFYNRNNASFEEGAAALAQLVSTIKSRTHADRVHIAGHSKGGLVARQYVVDSNGANVNRLILCQSPNLGSIWAADVSDRSLHYANLYPIWNWYRERPTQAYSPSSNPELAHLNALRLPRLPSAQAYTILYSNSLKTPVTRTAFNTSVGYGEGDSIVPSFSQLGLLFDPNHPSQSPHLIPAFQGVDMEPPVMIPGSHIGYMDLVTVQAAIFSRFAKLLQ